MPWTELAGTKLNDAPIWCGNAGAPAAPACLPRDLPGGGNNQELSTIDAWVSGCLMGDEFIFPAGGGHADWAGNQVLGFKRTGTPPWTMKRNASLAYPPAGSATYTPEYSDGTPSSKHTYDSIVWMPTKNRIYCGGGIYWSPGGASSPELTWWLNPADWSWTKKAVRPGGYGIASCWDPTANRVLLRLSGTFHAYNPDLEDAGPNAAAYTQLFAQNADTSTGSALALDPAERLVYRTNSGGLGTYLSVIDLNNLGAREVKLAVAGDTAFMTTPGLGLIYADGRLIALGRSTVLGFNSVYTADVKDRGRVGEPPVTWLRHGHAVEPPSQGTISSEPNWFGRRGFWKRWYGPVAGKYYFINQITHNVWEYTPDWSATTHTVDEARGLLVEMLP